MALFPQSFVDDLKAQTDIVSVIGDVTPLKKAGATYKGLCPFHTEKTPSFNVNKDKGFFHCFGCGVGGDVVKFVELYQKVTFPEAVRYLAQRASMPVPELSAGGAEDRVAAAEREGILKLHEDAATFAFAGVLAVGVAALGGLVFHWRAKPAPNWIVVVVLVLSVIVFAMMIRTANLGGLIRHPELRSDFRAQQTE